MDISVDRATGYPIPKKSGSLDLWSVSVKKSRNSDRKPRDGKTNFGVNQSGELIKTNYSFPSEEIGSNLAGLGRKRRRKEVSSSSFGLTDKKLHSGSVLHNLESSNSKLRQLGNDHGISPGKLGHECYKVCFNSENRDSSDGDVVIPKRPRVAPKCKRAADSICLKIETSTSNQEGTGNEDINKSSTKNLPVCQVFNGKHEEVNELNQTDRNITVPGSSMEDTIHISASDVKTGSKSNDGRSCLVDDGPLANDSEDFVAEFREDDEENLEENAARMLSSRFDPSCTGFSRSGDTYIKNGEKVPHLQFDHKSTLKGSHAGSSSDNPAIRNLRPRSQNAKSVARKRRHFYEVSYSDIDPLYIVKQRIRVFWPLDKSWYFGLVKGYDPVSKLHHIKYDDRDEEWINLQNERFKLLLFPSEASGNFGINKRKREGEIEDSRAGSMLDSEPLVSWLSRSNHHVNAGFSAMTRKTNRVIMPDGIKTSILLESQGDTSDPSDGSKLLLKHNLPCNEDITKFPNSKRPLGSNSAKLHYVYYRKRFRTQKEALDRKPEQNDNYKNSSSSVRSITSVANSTSTELIKLSIPILGLMTLTMMFSLPLQYLKKLVSGIGICWPYYAISVLQSRELICAWPIVHMEIVFVDKNSGLKLLFFEGCLRRAVSLFCLIMSTFDHCDMSTCTKEGVLTSMGFEISDSCYRERRLLIVFNNFSNIENSKWEYLEDQIKRNCTKEEVALADCTCSDIMDIAGAQYQNLFKGFTGTSCLDVVCNTMANELDDSNSNSTVHYVIDEHVPPRPGSFSFHSLLFSPSLHLKLIEKTAASLYPGKSTLVYLQECPDITDNFIANDFQTEDFSDHLLDATIQNRTSLGEGEAAVVSQETKDALLPNMDVESSGDIGNIMKNETVMQYEASCLTGPLQGADELYSLCHGHSSSADKTFYAIGESSCNTVNSHIQVFDQIEEHSNDKRDLTAHHATNMVMGINGQSFHGPTARRSMWRRSRNTSLSQTTNHHPKLWTDDSLSNGSSCGYKKPRSQVSFSVFSSDYELDTKSQNGYPKLRLNKKIKPSQENKVADCTVSSQSYMDTQACDANILVSDGIKGWREYGAQVILRSDDQKNWMICVKLSGTSKYVYKVNQSLQPGTTNRYTHAMMWRGGKDWALEFTDRSQWSLFKQTHEECYNRNIRAASIKNIPIPGVRLLSDVDRSIEVPFIHSSSKYSRHVQSDIDFALDPSHVLYDMDSDDEVWVSRLQDILDPKGTGIPKITDEMFERVMDMLEKLAYSQQRHEFTNDEIDELITDVGPSNIVKAIHEHWRLKRQKKGLPLIRQFQPPLWELYEKQLKEWESTINKMPSQPEGGQDKAYFNKKPPMFAFCLRPRGLEIPNKGSKHKSHKKLTLSSHNNTLLREKYYFPSSGRKSDGTSVGNEKALIDNSSHESSESIDDLQSLSSFSTRNTSSTESLSASEGSDRYPDPKPFRSRPIKMGNFHSPRDFHVIRHFSFNQRTKRSGVNKWNSEYLTWPSTKQKSPGFKTHQPDINEFTLRDASSAAQHALNMAKLKREKANWLLHKADLAVHRASVALMTAEAIKASEKDIIGDG